MRLTEKELLAGWIKLNAERPEPRHFHSNRPSTNAGGLAHEIIPEHNKRIMRLILKGMSQPKVAAELGVTPGVVAGVVRRYRLKPYDLDQTHAPVDKSLFKLFPKTARVLYSGEASFLLKCHEFLILQAIVEHPEEWCPVEAMKPYYYMYSDEPWPKNATTCIRNTISKLRSVLFEFKLYIENNPSLGYRLTAPLKNDD